MVNGKCFIINWKWKLDQQRFTTSISCCLRSLCSCFHLVNLPVDPCLLTYLLATRRRQSEVFILHLLLGESLPAPFNWLLDRYTLPYILCSDKASLHHSTTFWLKAFYNSSLLLGWELSKKARQYIIIDWRAQEGIYEHWRAQDW